MAFLYFLPHIQCSSLWKIIKFGKKMIKKSCVQLFYSHSIRKKFQNTQSTIDNLGMGKNYYETCLFKDISFFFWNNNVVGKNIIAKVGDFKKYDHKVCL